MPPHENDKKRMKTEDDAVSNFREYLRIKTVHPEPDYIGAINFLKRMAKELELPAKDIEVLPGRTVVIITWEGTDPTLKSLMLNSHTDVVPIFEEHWKCDAFGAIKMENGDIYGRGTQDMKSVGIQYLEAIRRIKKQGIKLLRTIHLTFVPDEEIGGKPMQALIKRAEFKDMNVGYVLDEGLANPTDAFTVFYGERAPWWIRVKCTGNPGHGSRFIENTAAEKLQKIINSFLSFRTEQKKKLQSDTCLALGDVTTVNLTKVEGGVAHNVVPAEMTACFDIRVTPTADKQDLEDKIKGWVEDAGEGITYDYVQKFEDSSMTSTSEEDPWWNAFSKACSKKNMQIQTEIFPAATDSRFLREAGYPAIGFSPMNKTPILLHDHNEFLNEDVFLNGIDIYEEIIPSLANMI